ncbi:MAG: 50S ribosomal protein L11 methyltransferase [Dehalococcoidia bacterium]|nr:50S ribosomal protein L11 methyltransferase [Dehalococcoidia bacterium]
MAGTQWVRVSVQVSPELVEPITELFNRYASNTVAIEQPGGFNPDEGESVNPNALVTVIAYYPNNSRAKWRKARIETGAKLLSLIRPIPPIDERIVDSAEWEENWKEHFPALRLGKRLLVMPPWLDAPDKSQGQVVLTLDPGLAFGTGHHPTTRRCLVALEEHCRPGSVVLDLGCGSGILGIAALKLGADSVLGLDTEAAATRATRQNARINGVGRLFHVRKGTLPQPDIGPFDMVLANISAKALIALAPQFKPVLRSGGLLIGSGLLIERRDEVVSALAENGLRLKQAYQDEDWVTLLCEVG